MKGLEKLPWYRPFKVHHEHGVSVGMERVKDGEHCAAPFLMLADVEAHIAALHTSSPAPAEPVADDKFLRAVKCLAFAARTTGGNAGRDVLLCEALDAVEPMLASLTAAKAAQSERFKNQLNFNGTPEPRPAESAAPGAVDDARVIKLPSDWQREGTVVAVDSVTGQLLGCMGIKAWTALAQPAPDGISDAMVEAAARSLCKSNAAACGVNESDNWNLDPEEFKADARAALESAIAAAKQGCVQPKANGARGVAPSGHWATGDQLPPIGVDVIGVWSSRDEFPPEVELCGVPQAGNPERQWFNAYGPCSAPDRWIHVPAGTWERATAQLPTEGAAHG